MKIRDDLNKTTAVEAKAIKVSLQEAKRDHKSSDNNKESQQLIKALTFELQMKSANVKRAQKDVEKNRLLLKKTKDNVLTL